MINALRLSLSSDHLGFPGQHAWHCPPNLGNRHLKDCRLSPSNHEETPLQSHSPSQAQSETRLTVSTPPAGSPMLDKATPCESCCSEGTRQKHHYRFPHYPHPRQVQNHPQELQEAHPVGRSQSKFHSLELYSHQNQHHRDYRQVVQEEHRDNPLFLGQITCHNHRLVFCLATFLLEIWNQIVENAQADNLIFRNSFIHQDRFR